MVAVLCFGLVPLGVAAVVIGLRRHRAVGEIEELDVLQMPNAMNVSLHGPTLMVFMVFMPAWPLLFSYMLKQKRKVLGLSLRKRKTR